MQGTTPTDISLVIHCAKGRQVDPVVQNNATAHFFNHATEQGCTWGSQAQTTVVDCTMQRHNLIQPRAYPSHSPSRCGTRWCKYVDRQTCTAQVTWYGKCGQPNRCCTYEAEHHPTAVDEPTVLKYFKSQPYLAVAT